MVCMVSKTSAENPEKLDFILSRKCYDWSYNKYNTLALLTSTDYITLPTQPNQYNAKGK